MRKTSSPPAKTSYLTMWPDRTQVASIGGCRSSSAAMSIPRLRGCPTVRGADRALLGARAQFQQHSYPGRSQRRPAYRVRRARWQLRQRHLHHDHPLRSGTSTCQKVNGILVDTGSSGLRVLSSALNGLALPQQTIAGTPLGNCVNFVDGSFLWGAVRLADIKISGRRQARFRSKSWVIHFFCCPNDCSTNSSGTEEDSLAALKANGILGVGLFQHDCGAACSASPSPNQYFACSQ